MDFKVFPYLFKFIRNLVYSSKTIVNQPLCRVIFWGQNVQYKSFKTYGLPYVSVALGSTCKIGQNFSMTNSLKFNPIGRPQKCVIFVDRGAKLQIGDFVGISQTAIVCHNEIAIGNHVKIGGGVCIYDTDFHSLKPQDRRVSHLDIQNKATSPVIVKNNVFIGAHSTILKGVTIGENSIIGACSVVTKNVPDNEIWAGNPAKKIRSLVI